MSQRIARLALVFGVIACSHGKTDQLPVASQTFATEAVCPSTGDALAALPVVDVQPERAAQVGTIDGEFAVSSGGAATYAMPLIVPPGRAGVEPRLAVQYSSSAGEGLLGMGMAIAGLSGIERCGSDYAQDGDIRAVKYDDGDHFCLDGARLVQVGELADGSIEYRTVPDRLAKVVARRAPGWPAGLGPTSFEVWMKSGRIVTYGGRPDGRVVVPGGVVAAWWITREEDRRANAIEYFYTNQTDRTDSHTVTFRPDYVDYTSHPDAPATRRVQFEYVTWAHHPDGYAGGGRVVHDGRLSRIKMLLLGRRPTVVRVYKLAYDSNPATGRALLDTIRECTSEDDVTCKPPTRFGWLTQPSGLQAAQTGVDGSAFLAINGSILADVNGDGLEDIVFEKVTVPGVLTFEVNVALNNGFNAYAAPTVWASQPLTIMMGQPTVIDFDQDGRADLLRRNEETWTVLHAKPDHTFELIDTGIATHWEDEFSVATCAGLLFGATTDAVSKYYVADVNGDAIGDILMCNNVVTCTPTAYCPVDPNQPPEFDVTCDYTSYWRLSFGMISGFSEPLAFPQLGATGCDNDVKLVDVQNDGKVDLLAPPPGFYEIGNIGAPFPLCGGVLCTYFLHEFDPDGTPDPTTGAPAGTWTVSDSGLPLHPLGNGKTTIFIDVNGDGLVDALRDGIDWPHTYLNTGAGFAPPVLSVPSPPGDLMYYFLDKAQPIDWDGDGAMDLILPIQTGVLGDPSVEEQVRWFVLRANFAGDGTLAPVNLGISEWDEPHLWVTDKNGDGRHDIVTLSDDDHDFRVRMTLGRHGLLSSITDGMNARDKWDPDFLPNITITYGNLVDDLVLQGGAPGSVIEDQAGYVARWSYQENDCTYPRACAVGPTTVVRAYASNDGHNQARSVWVDYRNGRYHKLGNGWLGFGARLIHDDVSKAGSAEFYDNVTYDPGLHRYLQLGRLTMSWDWVPALSWQPDTTEIAVTYKHMVNDVQSTAGGLSYFPVVVQTDMNRYEGDYLPGPQTLLAFVHDELLETGDLIGTSVHYVSDRDQYGNVLKEWDEVVGLEKTTYDRTFDNDDVDAWLLGQPDTEAVCSTAHPGDTQCRTTVSLVNGYGEVIQRTIETPGDPETWLASGADHDIFGNTIHAWADDAFGHHRSACVTYDSQGIYPVAAVNALGHAWYEHHDNGLGVVTAVKDPNGLTTTWLVDGFGRAVKELPPDGADMTIERVRHKDGGPAGNWWNVKTITSIAGAGQKTVELDMLGRTVHTWTAGSTVEACEQGTCMSLPVYQEDTEYDFFGTVQRTSRPHLTDAPAATIAWTEIERDSRGRPVSVTPPWGAVRTYEYGLATTSFTDSAGTAVTNADAMGRPVDVWDKKGTLTHFTYGPFGAVTEAVTADETSSYSTDAYGRVRTIVDPNRGLTRRTYNGFGELTSEADALGRSAGYVYDALGRPWLRADSDGITMWTYDPAGCVGCLASVESPDGVVQTFGHDALARVNSVTQVLGADTLEASLDYDGFGRPWRLHYPAAAGLPGPTVEYTYDPSGFMTNVTNVDSGEVYWQLEGVDGTGRPRLEQFGNGVRTAHEYAPQKGKLAHLLTWRGTYTYQDLHYGYDSRLNPTMRQDALQGATEYFEYDELDRLYCQTDSPKDLTCDWEVTYTPNGNIETRSDLGTYTYDPHHPHAVAEVGTLSFAYDLVGNQVGRPDATITYTPFDLPRTYTLTASGNEVSFVYDANHARTRKTSADAETLYMSGLYERETNMVTGVMEHRYTMAAGDAHVIVSRVAGAPDSTSYVHADALGSADLVTNQWGGVVEQRSYGPFGERRNPKWDQPPPGTWTDATTLGFAGLGSDDELGLVDMNGRIYDPHVGRFLQTDKVNSDPLFSQRWNAYSYVLNNPLKAADRSGWDANPDLEMGTTDSGSYTNSYVAYAGATDGPAIVFPDQMITVTLGNMAAPTTEAGPIAAPVEEVEEMVEARILSHADDRVDQGGQGGASADSTGGGGNDEGTRVVLSYQDEQELIYRGDLALRNGKISLITALVLTDLLCTGGEGSAVVLAGRGILSASGVVVAVASNPGAKEMATEMLEDAPHLVTVTQNVTVIASSPQISMEAQELAPIVDRLRGAFQSNLAENAKALLSTREFAASANPRLGNIMAGNAWERYLARSKEILDMGIMHLGGPNRPDYVWMVGKQPILLDTMTFGGIGSHLLRAYYNQGIPWIFLVSDSPF